MAIPQAITDMQLTATRTLTRPLAAPALTSTTTGPTTATLNWTAPTPTGVSVIAGYRLKRATAIAGPYTTLYTGLNLTFNDTVSSGTVYYTIEAFDQFVTGAVSSPLSVNYIGGSLSLIFNETWATTTASGFPTGTPYAANYVSIGDPGSVKNVISSTPFPPTGGNVALFDQTPPDRAARHDMVKYDGPERNLAAGVRYLLSFAFMLTGDWAAHPEIPGFFNIPFQFHPDDSGGTSGPLAQPMINLELTNGPGGPFQWQVVGYTKNQAQHRFAQYPFPDGTGFTGNIALNVWFGVVMDIVICSLADGSDGEVNIYAAQYPNPFPSVPQIQDRGLNDYLDDLLRPYFTFGIYHGEGGSSTQASLTGRHQVYWGPWKYARASAGATLANMKPW